MRGAEQYSWPLAELCMRHARRRNVPALPPTLVALADILETNPDRYTCCGHSFYQDRTIDVDGKVSIIFGCLDLIQEVIRQGGSELHADATFKVVPSSPKCRQLFVMHFNIQNYSIPIIYVLMESKTETAYTLVLRKCKALFPAIQPVCIMTYYENALKNAFSNIYPESIQNACYFHYVQVGI
ncbi:uncharacterized protein LOC107885085 [Acyrthosiphon pisum]|uniref:MULE transposase domain-containing protein n=1 Tax=Acyrthosiphon pisum TaxID=7029 RepID=A0A8R2JT74_ACYPI|nr:uncharacterized protein LOC107885085 [Acyrthosiphon pisum]